MSELGSDRLRIGVVGLGKLWELRHKPALARMRDRIEVVAVYDQVARRAAIEAAHLRCDACDGLTSLIERGDVDAVYLLSPQWFGLHAIELACRLKKSVYCALPMFNELDELEAVVRRVGESGIRVFPEFARRSYPATLRLRELLATSLGAPRLIVGQCRLVEFDRHGAPGPAAQLQPAPLLIDPGCYLIDWCGVVFESAPISIQAFGGRALNHPNAESADDAISDLDFAGFVLRFARGETAQIDICRYHREAWGDASRFLPAPGFQVFARRGAAWVEPPSRVQWTDAEGAHDERLPHAPDVGEILNDQFLRTLRGEPTLAPTLDEVVTIARYGACLRQSLREQRAIDLTP